MLLKFSQFCEFFSFSFVTDFYLHPVVVREDTLYDIFKNLWRHYLLPEVWKMSHRHLATCICCWVECPISFPGGTSGEESTCQCRRHKVSSFDSWVVKIPWMRKMATHSSILPWKFPWTREAWWATVHGVAKSLTWLNTDTQWIFHICLLNLIG